MSIVNSLRGWHSVNKRMDFLCGVCGVGGPKWPSMNQPDIHWLVLFIVKIPSSVLARCCNLSSTVLVL